MNDRIELDPHRLLGLRIAVADAPHDPRIGDKAGVKPVVSMADADIGIASAKLGPKNGQKPV